MKYPPITPDIVPEIARLYASGSGCQCIAEKVGSNSASVRRALLSAGVVMRPIGSKGMKCVDCGRPTAGARRCPRHLKLRYAMLNREFQRRKTGVRNPYLEF